MQTLGDLKTCFRLYGVCTPCRRMMPMDINVLIDRYGAHLSVAVLRRRIRCLQCNERTGELRIVYVGEGGKAAGFHYRR